MADAPAQDTVTAAAPAVSPSSFNARRAVTNYMPPVHVPPPAAGAYTATPSSDCIECEASATGELIRRPGLQDKISGAMKRFAPEPTEAVGSYESSQPAVAERRGSAQSVRGSAQSVRGSARASGSFADQLTRTEKVRRARSQSAPTLADPATYRNEQSFDSEPSQDRYARRIETAPTPARRPVSLASSQRHAADSRDRRVVSYAAGLQDRTNDLDRYEVGEPDWVDEEIEQVVMVDSPRTRSRQSSPPARVARAKQSRSSSYAMQRRSSVRGKQVSVLTRQDNGSRSATPKRIKSVTNRLRAPSQAESADNDFGGFEANDRLRRKLEDVPDSGIRKIDDFDELNGLADDDDMLDDLDREMEDLDDLEDLDDDSDIDDDEESVAKPPIKSCGEFRNELLGSSIRDIALDISPPASSLPNAAYSMGRTWTDRSGNVIATGSMSDLRRGYVILDSGQKIAYARLSEGDWAAVSEFWRLPTVCSVGDRGSVQRNWIPQTFTWTAANLCHKPLYFENRQLERYGHSHGPFTQPIQSFVHFAVSFVALPYQMSINPANECQYALGYYRPGNCAPWLKDPIPLSLDAARRQALFVTGMAFLP